MHGGSSTILTVGALFLPETPSSVIQRTKNQEKARKVLEKIRGTSEIELELDDLTLASQISISIHNPFRTILPLDGGKHFSNVRSLERRNRNPNYLPLDANRGQE
ncbi:Hexose carrier protein HEX6 [Linum perenne]